MRIPDRPSQLSCTHIHIGRQVFCRYLYSTTFITCNLQFSPIALESLKKNQIGPVTKNRSLRQMVVIGNWGKLECRKTDYSLQPRIRHRIGEWSFLILGFVEFTQWYSGSIVHMIFCKNLSISFYIRWIILTSLFITHI